MKKVLLLTLFLLFGALGTTTLANTKHNEIVDSSQSLDMSKIKTPISESFISNTESPIVEISFWAFPIGDFSKKEMIESFIVDFNKLYPNIKVNVKNLDYSSGDAQIEEAIEARKAPDIVMEGPERLLANWGARGLMIDLRDIWDEETTAGIRETSEEILRACQAPDGAFYEYPMVMTTHVMAINYEIFEKANALQFIDIENRSWTADGFVSAMEAIRDSGLVESPGIIYSGGQGGDQGTRALVTNLYGASFTNDDHSQYTINKEEGVRGLSLLQKMVENGSLSHNPKIVASDELQKFAKQDTAITLAWNATNESHYSAQIDFTPFAMNFPSNSDKIELQGGIWGFGIFNNGDMNKVKAAKKFIEFLVDDPSQKKKSVRATNFFPTNSKCGNVYIGTVSEEKMLTYMSFLSNLGDYYQVTPAWPEQRVAWYKLLQKVFSGYDAKLAADEYVETLNYQINP